MRNIMGAALVAVLAFATGLRAEDKQEKIDAKKLVGKWEPAEAQKGATIVVEFTADGKVNITFEAGGKKEKISGKYKVEGNSFSVTMDEGGKERTDKGTIAKLTDDEFVTVDEKGKKDTLKRIKEKK